MEPGKAIKILEEAVSRAEKNGYQFEMVDMEEYIRFYRGLFFQLIFNHDFAKALWGEKEAWIDGSKQPRYLAELACMAMQDEPLKYIEEFLRED